MESTNGILVATLTLVLVLGGLFAAAGIASAHDANSGNAFDAEGDSHVLGHTVWTLDTLHDACHEFHRC